MGSANRQVQAGLGYENAGCVLQGCQFRSWEAGGAGGVDVAAPVPLLAHLDKVPRPMEQFAKINCSTDTTLLAWVEGTICTTGTEDEGE